MQGRVHAERGLGSAGSRGRVRHIVALLRGLLKSIEIGNVHPSISGMSFRGWDSAVHVRCSIAGARSHRGLRCLALNPVSIGAAADALPLLTRRGSEARKAGLLPRYDRVAHCAVLR